MRKFQFLCFTYRIIEGLSPHFVTDFHSGLHVVRIMINSTPIVRETNVYMYISDYYFSRTCDS